LEVDPKRSGSPASFQIRNKKLCSYASQDEIGEISSALPSRRNKTLAAVRALASQGAIGEISA
jgi:hypothetical protein